MICQTNIRNAERFAKYNEIICGHNIIHLRSKNMILFIGGFVYSDIGYLKTIYSYSTIHNKWTKLNMKLPMEITPSSSALTKDEQYVILFGGFTIHEWESKDNIFVVDLIKMTIREFH